jgi:folate-binding Fe-S cluster repair protein YgfZ
MTKLPPALQSLLRTTPTIAPIPNRALLSITGSQATQWLNGLLSSTVPDPPRGHFYSAFLHAQARLCSSKTQLIVFELFEGQSVT